MFLLYCNVLLKPGPDFIGGSYQFLHLKCLRVIPWKARTQLSKKIKITLSICYWLTIRRRQTASNPHKIPLFLPVVLQIILFVIQLIFIFSSLLIQQALLFFRGSIMWILQNDLAQTSLHLDLILLALMKPKIRSSLSIGKDKFLNTTRDQLSAGEKLATFDPRQKAGFWRNHAERHVLFGVKPPACLRCKTHSSSLSCTSSAHKSRTAEVPSGVSYRFWKWVNI